MNLIIITLVGIVVAGLVAQLGMWTATAYKLRRSKTKLAAFQARQKRLAGFGTPFQPPISVLKPLAGADVDLLENLRSFARQEYPNFELLFGIQRANDPAIQVVEQLKSEFPNVAISIVHTENSQSGYNPKVNNLLGIIPHARFEHMVISDSNVLVAPDYLASNIRYFESPVVGIVTNLIRAKGGESVGSLLESLHMNTFVMGSVSLADEVADQTVVIGKSIFFRRTQMNQLGGLQRFANYLAEDYLMGRAYAKAGYEVILSGYTIDTVTNRWSMEQFTGRHTRWAQLRWNINKPAYVTELLTNCSFWSVVLLLASGFSPAATAGLLTVWGAKILGDMVQNRMLGRPLPSYYFLASPVKDILIAAIFPRPILSSKTNWRGTTLKVKKDSLLVSAAR